MASADLVSIVIPCFNEEKTIGLLLEAISRQTYPAGNLEIILADGHSTDQTLARVADFQRLHPELRINVLDNPARIIPAALNLAIRAARGEYIIRMDAHSIPAATYIEQCVADLKAGRGDNVGGLWLIQPGGPSWMARSIAVAASHPLGAGDARYRFSTMPGEVDTVPFGAFHRSLFDQIGLFNESLQVNEDYEFNARIRANGGKIFFNPAIRTQYFARPTLSALARQYWRYGYWKWRMLRRYPGTLRWRQALPPILVAAAILLLLLSIWFFPARIFFLAGAAVYLLILIAASISPAIQHKDLSMLIGIPLAIGTMHFSWGGGFLWSMIHPRG